MGFVFKARQPKIERFVALKILPASLSADPAFAERFTREGRLLARLNHPNIVAIHDFGQANGFFYLLMEFVDGVNLRQAMKAGRFTPAQALAIVPKICEALQFAHNEGILHRDIKPENLLLDSKGRVKIADFGIAKLLDEPAADASLTGSGAVLGTPHYMAPEQLEKFGQVDQRADIYSVGVVFYEMLTGELPLGRFQPPSAKVQVDVRLDEVVLHALEKEPARRYQQVSQVRTAVETISGSTAGPAGPVGTPPPVAAAAGPAPRPDRFWRWFALAMMALIMIPVGLAVVGMLASIAIPTIVKARKAAQDRARHQQSLAQPGKTVVLTGATNELLNAATDLRLVRVHTDSTLFPGETLVAMTQLLDGRIVDSFTSFFIRRRADGVQTSAHFSWALGDAFSPDDFESAAAQLRAKTSGRPLDLAPGRPVELFSVTNWFGGIVRGFLRFERVVPELTTALAGSGTNVEATVRLRPYGGGLLAFYTASVPQGYFLEAADNSSELGDGESSTSINGGPAGCSSSWRPPRSFPYELQREAGAQLQRFAEEGPLRVVYGEPRQVFAITNKNGEVYRGFFELVAPPAGGSATHALPERSAHTRSAPSLPSMRVEPATGRPIPAAAPGAAPSSTAGATYDILHDARLRSAVGDAEERVRLREPTIPGPTPVNTSFTEPSASVERWQPTLAPGQKPNLDSMRQEAKDLAKSGQYEPALQRHLWYHNHALEYDPNQRGVRLSFALADWVELGRKYPKAKQALLEIRDGNTRKLVEARGSSQLFKDLAAINREYASEDATYALFKTLWERDPALARRCYNLVEDLLVKKREYALCLTCLGDYQARFASIREEWEQGKSWEDNISRKLQRIPSRPGVPSFVPPPYYDKRFVEETRRLIEILVGTGRKAEAGKIQEQAVAALDDARLKSALADAEKRTRS